MIALVESVGLMYVPYLVSPPRFGTTLPLKLIFTKILNANLEYYGGTGTDSTVRTNTNRYQ